MINWILSLGLYRRWQKKLVDESQVQSQHHVLDCATGTGEVAFLFESRLTGTGTVIGSDFCESMLTIARSKAKRKRSLVQFEWADVLDLPYASETFDRVSISFGIRNVQSPEKAFQEFDRVLKPGGRLLILEFGQPHWMWMKWVFQGYSKYILPWIGGYLSGHPAAYHYLRESSAHFPCGADFLQRVQGVGSFESRRWISLQAGIAYLYLLEKRGIS